MAMAANLTVVELEASGLAPVGGADDAGVLSGAGGTASC